MNRSIATELSIVYDLRGHMRADWGSVSNDDWKTDFNGLVNGNRLLSACPTGPSRPSKGQGENCLWIITEADRSVTTFLLPGEY